MPFRRAPARSRDELGVRRTARTPAAASPPHPGPARLAVAAVRPCAPNEGEGAMALRHFFRHLFRDRSSLDAAKRGPRPRAARPWLEALEDRLAPASLEVLADPL